MKVNRLMMVAMIAAIYAGLCFIPGLSSLAYGPIQVRIAEALTLLPILDYYSIFGVTLGCFLANLIGLMNGANPIGLIDLLVGTTATFLAANATYALRNRLVHNIPIYSYLMPVIFNFFFVGIELAFLFMPDNLIFGTLLNGTYVAIGELIAVILGHFLLKALKKTPYYAKLSASEESSL
ncbi:MAG: QueT transporter family protein [Solobacterium sp.]|nr:QueT transporter family protein [Solobacterium sp.]